MRRLALVVALALAAPAAAEDLLPPPPPPPSFDAPLPPPSYDPPRAPADPAPRPGVSAPATGAAATGVPVRAPRKLGTIGEAPVAPAGSQAAPLHPDEAISHWKTSLATGVLGRFGGMKLDDARANPGVLLYFGGQADGLWTNQNDRWSRAARLRLRMFTGGETEVYIPSDGEVEAAYMIGRREFRFVVGRLEVGRSPALGLQVLAQVATLPSFEGSLSLAGDTMRLYYYVSPVEAAYAFYYGDAHIDHSAAWATESDRPSAASAARVRYTVLLPPSLLLSLQGDLMKMWGKADLLLSAEGTLGYQVLDQSVIFNVGVRWNSYRRRGLTSGATETDAEMKLLAMASLLF